MPKIKNKKILNSSGFIAADFLFSFVLVISCGIIIFALTFSLATTEIAQYITWSAARSYSAAALAINGSNSSKKAADDKFKNLSAKFPLLTGNGADSPWFVLTLEQVGDDASRGMADMSANLKNNSSTSPTGTENRHPWTGVSSKFELKLFQSIRIPFIGKISSNPDVFTFPLRAFILRNPSQEECLGFFKKRIKDGIQPLEPGWNSLPIDVNRPSIEDNGC